jgi:hypothetical protein
MTNGPRRLWRVATIAAASVVALVLISLEAPAQARSDNQPPEFYVAMGGSASVGVQPTPGAPEGAPTDDGYANDLLSTERSTWPSLRLIKLGCPNETTNTLINGGDRCYPSGSQLSTALAFLHHHRASTVLLTVDVGFNDLVPCLEHDRVASRCVVHSIGAVRRQLSTILVSLQAAAGPHMRIVGVGHYDPYLGAYLDGPEGRRFAIKSLAVLSSLNKAMRSTYGSAGVPMADVAGSFGTTSTQATALAGVGTVPRDVARTCSLTWMCDPGPHGPNPHPDDAGYRAISRAVALLVADR